MISAAQCDDALFSSISIDYETLESRRNDLVLFREQENGARMRDARVGDAIEVGWNLRRHRAGQHPKIPPAVLAAGSIAERGRIMQNQTRDRPMRRDVQCRRAPDARAEKDNGTIPGFVL